MSNNDKVLRSPPSEGAADGEASKNFRGAAHGYSYSVSEARQERMALEDKKHAEHMRWVNSLPIRLRVLHY